MECEKNQNLILKSKFHKEGNMSHSKYSCNTTRDINEPRQMEPFQFIYLSEMRKVYYVVGMIITVPDSFEFCYFILCKVCVIKEKDVNI